MYSLPVSAAAPSSHELDNYQLAARTLREAVKDKSYRIYDVGREVGNYLRWKRGQISQATYNEFETCLDKLARAFPDLQIGDFEPPVGVDRLEDFMRAQWGDSAPRTYNKNLSIVKGFFKWCVLRDKLHGDPSLPLVPYKKRDVHRTTFSSDASRKILADGPHPDHFRRDRCALTLLLKYGVRKGALQSVKFGHCDRNRRVVTIFTKGGKVRELPVVDPAWWDDLEKLSFEREAKPDHFLMSRRKAFNCFRGYDRETGKPKTERVVKEYPDKPMSGHGLHDWWYGCLERAEIVLPGQRSGEKMHKARHTAGQRVLDKTGNLKATQKLLGHASIQTTADVYTDWDLAQLAETLTEVYADE